jgi:hypothetical protein
MWKQEGVGAEVAKASPELGNESGGEGRTSRSWGFALSSYPSHRRPESSPTTTLAQCGRSTYRTDSLTTSASGVLTCLLEIVAVRVPVPHPGTITATSHDIFACPILPHVGTVEGIQFVPSPPFYLSDFQSSWINCTKKHA